MRFNWSRASSKGAKETCNSRFVSRPVAERGIEGCVPTATGTVVHRNSSNARCNGSLWPYRGECWESWRTFCLWDGNSPLAWEKENVPPPSCCPLGEKVNGSARLPDTDSSAWKLRDPAARQRFPLASLVKNRHARIFGSNTTDSWIFAKMKCTGHCVTFFFFFFSYENITAY